MEPLALIRSIQFVDTGDSASTLLAGVFELCKVFKNSGLSSDNIARVLLCAYEIIEAESLTETGVKIDE